jgi:CheY-like chemotaxis protein
MGNTTKNRVLVVDDEREIRDVIAILLGNEGYKVSGAKDGFDALLQLRMAIPDLIISDLNMPHMSGFELLSVVRRRFPEIPVIAFSGAYHSGDKVPGGVLADAFFAKGEDPEALLRLVAEVLRPSAARDTEHIRKTAPVWIPRNGKDSKGVPYIVLTCTECLRSFPLSVQRQGIQEVQEKPCSFCGTTVRYIIDFSVDVLG